MVNELLSCECVTLGGVKNGQAIGVTKAHFGQKNSVKSCVLAALRMMVYSTCPCRISRSSSAIFRYVTTTITTVTRVCNSRVKPVIETT